jgi:hypothetical protein
MSVASRDLVVVADLQGLRLCDVWDIEDRLQEATAEVSDYINDQIRFLVGEGWTQTQIAEECKRAQQTVSDRMRRLGIEPASNRGRPRQLPVTGNSEPEPPDAEVLDGELVVENEQPRKPDPAPGPRAVGQHQKLLGGITERATHIADLAPHLDLEVIAALSEEEKELCKRQLSDARTALSRIIAAL